MWLKGGWWGNDEGLLDCVGLTIGACFAFVLAAFFICLVDDFFVRVANAFFDAEAEFVICSTLLFGDLAFFSGFAFFE